MRVTMCVASKSIVMAMLLTGASAAQAAWPERPVVLVVPSRPAASRICSRA